MIRIRFIGAIVALGLGLAACSSGSSGTVYGGSGGTATTGSQAGATVSTDKVGSLGTVLVNDAGYTLYLFENDTGSTSTCVGACASTWPALTTTGDPAAGTGANASMLGTTSRDDGSTQVTYDGHPLYIYSGDSAAGQANGEGISGVWFAVSTDGTPAQAGGGGGGGYGAGGGYGQG